MQLRAPMNVRPSDTSSFSSPKTEDNLVPAPWRQPTLIVKELIFWYPPPATDSCPLDKCNVAFLAVKQGLLTGGLYIEREQILSNEVPKP